MQYAIIDNIRSEAFPGGRGSCSICGSAMVAKCGPRKMHHWAHFGRRNCDPWWESETAWHRNWKNLFPENCREVVHTSPDGELHRADIKSPTGIIIEVQHSNITDAERISREIFYRNLVWVVDGSVFRQNFNIYHLLPDPDSVLAEDLVWTKATRNQHGAAHGLFFRLSEGLIENPEATKANLNSGWIHGIHEIESHVNQLYIGHHQYDWIRPRRTWLEAECPVYIDFGGNFLARLEIYDDSGLPCVRLVSKRIFVHDAMNKSDANNIARETPLTRTILALE